MRTLVTSSAEPMQHAVHGLDKFCSKKMGGSGVVVH